MLIAAIIALGTSAVPAEMPMLPEAAAFASEAAGWLLEGRNLPPDYRLRLMRMPPEARLQALVFLRRSGLLTADAWPLDDILRPLPPEDGDAR